LEELQGQFFTPDAIAVAPFGSASEGGDYFPNLPGPLSALPTEGNKTHVSLGTDELDMSMCKDGMSEMFC